MQDEPNEQPRDWDSMERDAVYLLTDPERFPTIWSVADLGRVMHYHDPDAILRQLCGAGLVHRTSDDRRLLGVLCAHRVVTQAQLGRLFPGVPERTLRYRTRRLHALGLAGRSRPYREQGSAPNHHWPTRRADCLMRGEPAQRGGERSQPNPLFLAHAAALTDLYVALQTEASQAGLSVLEYRREGNAREVFDSDGEGRALAPDAMLILADGQGRKFGAFVEIDLGTMSHTRLRQKAELYAAYAASDAWHERHLFLPALLFLTTTDARAAKFVGTLTRALSYGPREHRRRALVAGAAGIAWAPRRLLDAACLADLDGNVGLALVDILPGRARTARAGARQPARTRGSRRGATARAARRPRGDAPTPGPLRLRTHLVHARARHDRRASDRTSAHLYRHADR